MKLTFVRFNEGSIMAYFLLFTLKYVSNIDQRNSRYGNLRWMNQMNTEWMIMTNLYWMNGKELSQEWIFSKCENWRSVVDSKEKDAHVVAINQWITRLKRLRSKRDLCWGSEIRLIPMSKLDESLRNWRSCRGWKGEGGRKQIKMESLRGGSRFTLSVLSLTRVEED